MSSFILVALTLIALVLLALATLVRIARHPLWSRLVLAAILTRIFDRPHATRPLRGRI